MIFIVMENLRLCLKCNCEKEIEKFVKRNNGYRHQCKECYNKYLSQRRKSETFLNYSREYRKNNREKLKQVARKSYRKQIELNEVEYRKKIKIWRQNSDKTNEKEVYKRTREKNRDKIRERNKKYNKKRRENDSLFKLSNSIRRLINHAFKNNKKSSKTQQILGCTFEEFKQYLESKFESWMTWENYGNKNGIAKTLNFSWDLDHIVPLSSAKSEEEIIKLNHYTNFQPLCSYINRYIKKDKN